MSDFCHLHCHTEYSLFEGCIRIEDLCSRAVEYKMPAVSITDSGNLFGGMKLYSKAREYGIKPIIGCEVNLAPEKVTDRDSFNYHLVLLAMDLHGYQNLVRLVSAGWMKGFYYKPRVDKDMLHTYSNGLIALSACMEGEVQYLLRTKGFDHALEAARQYASIFPDRFYLELEASGLKEQAEVNGRLMEMSEKTGLPMVATNDCRYLTPQDAEAYAALRCIQKNKRLDHHDLNSRELYFKSPEEMEKEFSHCPTALENVQKIIEQCGLDLEYPKRHLPKYTPSAEDTLDKELMALSEKGLEEKLANFPYEVDRDEYFTRLDKELKVICEQGESWYFLVVHDYVSWAKSRGIVVGPGRGFATGSMTAYALGITGVDPIRHRLYFEKFFNTKTGLKDIDVDFCHERRKEVFEYLREKYGQANAVYPSVFVASKARVVLRDVGQVMGFSLDQVEQITSLIPEKIGITVSKALEMEPALRNLMNDNEEMQRYLDICKRLDRLVRHVSIHAAGIVISNEKLQSYLPLYSDQNKAIVSQYDWDDLRRLGFVKFDFLGLKYLSLISRTLDLIKGNNKQIPNMENLSLDDTLTFDLLDGGLTEGVFQLESSGMRNALMDLTPTCFEDIIALHAIYRPAFLQNGMDKDFIKRKHGLVSVEYPHPDLEPILNETHGLIIYQEQLIEIAHTLAGYSLEEGDTLRRVLGKKEATTMAEQREKFIQKARDKGLDQLTAKHVFELMEKFAGYTFCKSHSVAYSMIAYQTAYLKAHYPEEFQRALSMVFNNQ